MNVLHKTAILVKPGRILRRKCPLVSLCCPTCDSRSSWWLLGNISLNKRLQTKQTVSATLALAAVIFFVVALDTICLCYVYCI